MESQKGKVFYRAARRPRNEAGAGPGYEEKVSWIEGDVTFEEHYVRAVSHSDDAGDERGKVYDFIIPWGSVLYIELESPSSLGSR